MHSIEQRIELILTGVNITKDFKYFDTSLDDILENLFENLFGKDALEKERQFAGYPKRYHTGWDGFLRMNLEQSSYPNSKIQQIISRVEDTPRRNFLLLFLIEKSLKENEVDFAKEIITLLPDKPGEGPFQTRGNILLLKYFAQKGDIDNFNQTLLVCDKKQRLKMFEAKSLLINTLTIEKGFEFTFRLVKNKTFGEKFYYSLLEPLAAGFEIEDFEKLFSSYPEFSNLSETLKVNLYVKSLVVKQKIQFNEERFNKVLKAVLNLDPKIKSGDLRLRDSLLWDMACSCKNSAAINICKKNIVNPAIKGEVNAYVNNNKSSIT